MDRHGFRGIEHLGDQFLLVCNCGWRSRPGSSAAAVGEDWDEHRAEQEQEQRVGRTGPQARPD